MVHMTHMTATEHWKAWLDRYGDIYETDEERLDEAYRAFKSNLAEMREVFDQDR